MEERGRVGRLSTMLHPSCDCLPRGNGPSNGKVVPHLHNHYNGDRKSFWETINVVLRGLKKTKTQGKKGLKCLKEDLVSRPDKQQGWQVLVESAETNSSNVFSRKIERIRLNSQ